MFKLFKNFKPIDWLLTAVLAGIVCCQVYFDLKLPDYTADIMTALTTGGTTKAIWKIGIKMLLVSLAGTACSVVVGYFASHLSAKFARVLRREMFSKVNTFSGGEINKFSTASLITRSTNDISQVQMTTTMLFRMAIAAPVTAVWAIVKIQAKNLPLTLAVGASIVALIVFIITLFTFALPKFKAVQELTDKLNGVTRENLTGLRVVKAYNADAYQEEKFERVNGDLLKNNVAVNRIMALVFPFIFLIMHAITLTVYWLGARLITNGTLDFPTMVSFSMLAMQVLMSFMMLTMLFLLVPRAAVSGKRVAEVLDTETSVKDGVGHLTHGEASMEFKNVSFRYPDSESYVIKDVSFEAKKGETIAFIGSTGSGKSTLINLIPRFFDATEGEILLCGVNIKDMTLKDLRSRIGYVPQKGVLFSGTVSSNIGYGKDGLSEEEIKNAAVIAKADEFVEKMEGGYDAAISQGGKNVSGGQKQRLSIARAAAISPDIYIFDDSFSALDYKTDKEVRANLKRSTRDSVCFIVAQRIGTIMEADKIIVLDNGKVVGLGRHKELLQTCEVYKEIASSQLSKEELGL